VGIEANDVEKGVRDGDSRRKYPPNDGMVRAFTFSFAPTH
jgi:hypothetical protein